MIALSWHALSIEEVKQIPVALQVLALFGYYAAAASSAISCRLIWGGMVQNLRVRGVERCLVYYEVNFVYAAFVTDIEESTYLGTSIFSKKSVRITHPWGLLEHSRHLVHRSPVHSPRPHEVIDQAEDDNRTRHQDSIVHVFCRDRPFSRPKAEEDHNGQITTCDSIVHVTPNARYMPGAPSELLVPDHVRPSGRTRRDYRSGTSSV